MNWSKDMNVKTSNRNKYILAFTLGAIAGGAGLAWATNAIPRMMPKMMQSMMTQMAKEGHNPEEM